MQIDRIKVAPDTITYAVGETKLNIEFAIPGAPADTIDLKILKDSVHLTAPARDFEYADLMKPGRPISRRGRRRT